MQSQSAIMALSHFDRLVQVFAKRGTVLSAKEKDALDAALKLHENACEKLKLCPTKDYSSRIVMPDEA